jgi:hypothetical protein
VHSCSRAAKQGIWTTVYRRNDTISRIRAIIWRCLGLGTVSPCEPRRVRAAPTQIFRDAALHNICPTSIMPSRQLNCATPDEARLTHPLFPPGHRQIESDGAPVPTMIRCRFFCTLMHDHATGSSKSRAHPGTSRICQSSQAVAYVFPKARSTCFAAQDGLGDAVSSEGATWRVIDASCNQRQPQRR